MGYRLSSVEQEELDRRNTCEYCGNKSTFRDSRGNCLGCGAVRPPSTIGTPHPDFASLPSPRWGGLVSSSTDYEPPDHYISTT